MRKTVTGLAVVAATALLAGCGSGGGSDDAAAGEKDNAAEASARPSDGGGQDGGGSGGAEGDRESSEASGGASGGGKGDGGGGGGGGDKGAGGGEVTRTVTLEVEGDGKTQIYYTAGTNETEQATLPWRKTVELSLTEAERKAGVLVSIVPGTVMNDAGEFAAASCVIKVDGRKVDDNGNGKDVSGCEYKVR
ncbi:hypothetical protein F0L17_15780 [Streptomyces sp. TRM43335]|uniref:MmpS family membrane protein n=1 Tax=Streptomyces taklimakanensis TaxID=2569853 RepID=A0A6G2BEN4_9ACTN|nr:hypothetical protein [Streptomyces taklimakanensis]MTE20539.1 hypothetical protein [Streptomyces taklimakanensis]